MYLIQNIERNHNATLYVGNLAPDVTEDILWELCIQAGIVKSIHLKRDQVTGLHNGFAFVEYESEAVAKYALKILSTVHLYNRLLKVTQTNTTNHQGDLNAVIFVGNLDETIDEVYVYDICSTVGQVIDVKLCYNSTSGRKYALVVYSTYAYADAAIEKLNGQYIKDRPLIVEYAHKNDHKAQYGSEAERILSKYKQANSSTKN